MLKTLLVIMIIGSAGKTIATRSRYAPTYGIFKMLENSVVPDVVDVAPPLVVNVQYKSGVCVKMGNELTPTQVKDVPTVTYSSDPKKLYTLACVDPDAPSRANPKAREWQHWLVVNIPGDDVAKGETLTEYVGAGPPKGTGLHRYIFLVYMQPEKLQFKETKLTNYSDKGRPKFSISKFATKYNLGKPVAGNLFQSKWDDYVPKLYEQLSGKTK